MPISEHVRSEGCGKLIVVDFVKPTSGLHKTGLGFEKPTSSYIRVGTATF